MVSREDSSPLLCPLSLAAWRGRGDEGGGGRREGRGGRGEEGGERGEGGGALASYLYSKTSLFWTPKIRKPLQKYIVGKLRTIFLNLKLPHPSRLGFQTSDTIGEAPGPSYLHTPEQDAL